MQRGACADPCPPLLLSQSSDALSVPAPACFAWVQVLEEDFYRAGGVKMWAWDDLTDEDDF